MKTRFKSGDYTSARLSKSIFSILKDVTLCGMATVGPGNEAHVNTAYFCYSDALDLYFISNKATQHCQNILRSPTIAIAVFNTNQPWGKPIRGLQLFGKCHLASTRESDTALECHASRFPAYVDYIKSLSPLEREKSPYQFYVFRPMSVKIVDELEFGEETCITAEVLVE